MAPRHVTELASSEFLPITLDSADHSSLLSRKNYRPPRSDRRPTTVGNDCFGRSSRHGCASFHREEGRLSRPPQNGVHQDFRKTFVLWSRMLKLFHCKDAIGCGESRLVPRLRDLPSSRPLEPRGFEPPSVVSCCSYQRWPHTKRTTWKLRSIAKPRKSYPM